MPLKEENRRVKITQTALAIKCPTYFIEGKNKSVPIHESLQHGVVIRQGQGHLQPLTVPGTAVYACESGQHSSRQSQGACFSEHLKC